MTASIFTQTLESHALELGRGETTTLQVNVGRRCDLACRHCHLEAGPQRSEMMTAETIAEVIACAQRLHFETIDITGGAPELLPQLPDMLDRLAPLTSRLIVRSNLTALSLPASARLPELYRRLKVVLVASLPSLNAAQTAAQRGNGTWETCIAMLRSLNAIGYGSSDSGLELDLVANPAGAFLPSGQTATERRFRQELLRRYNISFNNLFTFANVPLGRFRSWLEQSGNLDSYSHALAEAFNPCTLPGLMCRSIISVDWDGFLYDCDFNLATGLHHGGTPLHISTLTSLPASGTPIPVGDHCFSCTAGTGFT